MTTYSVADARNNLPKLIDQALDGQEVIITRHGRPVAELKPTAAIPVPPDAAGAYEWLRSRRRQRPSIGVTSVELLNEMYDDPDG